MPPQNQQYPEVPQNGPPGPQPAAPQNPQPGQPVPQPPVDPNAPAQPYQFPAKPREPEENPYEFFMEPPKQVRPGLNLGLSDTPAKKFIFVVVAIFAFLGLLAAILAMASKPSTSSTGLLKIAQDQQEMIRVAGNATTNSHNDDLQNFAVTLQLGLTSAQQGVVTYMAKTGTKTNDKSLSLSQNPKTDQALNAALAADTYDTMFESIMRASLSTYDHDLNEEAGVAQTTTEKKLLQDDIASAELLQKMLPQPPQ